MTYNKIEEYMVRGLWLYGEDNKVLFEPKYGAWDKDYAAWIHEVEFTLNEGERIVGVRGNTETNSKSSTGYWKELEFLLSDG